MEVGFWNRWGGTIIFILRTRKKRSAGSCSNMESRIRITSVNKLQFFINHPSVGLATSKRSQNRSPANYGKLYYRSRRCGYGLNSTIGICFTIQSRDLGILLFIRSGNPTWSQRNEWILFSTQIYDLERIFWVPSGTLAGC